MSEAHDEGVESLRQVVTVHEFPLMYFVENIAVRKSGGILVTIHNRNELVFIDPSVSQQKPVVVHTFSAGASGIVEVDQDIFYVSAGAIGEKGSYTVYKVDMSKFSTDGSGNATTPAEISKFADIPDALFLNGSTLLSLERGLILLADSILGSIYVLNVRSPKVDVWLQHQLLAKVTPDPMMPGVNGIKKRDQYLYCSNTDAKTLLRVTISDGGDAGEIDIFQEKLNADDFAFDADGNAYLTTHVFQSVVKLASDGTRSRIAGGVGDKICAGTTAAAFGRTDNDKTSLYVTTTGGISFPVDGKIENARLLKIDVGH